MIKFRHLIAALPLLVPTFASADEPVDTVRVLMDMAIHNSGDPADGKSVQEEYFSANMLLRFFSKDFNDAFAQAFLKANEKRYELLIDWDPIIGGQDSCPVKDVSYGAPSEKAGKIALSVKYNATHCFGDGGGQMSEVTFTLVKEEPLPGSVLYLIDDISHEGEPSLRTTLGEAAR